MNISDLLSQYNSLIESNKLDQASVTAKNKEASELVRQILTKSIHGKNVLANYWFEHYVSKITFIIRDLDLDFPSIYFHTEEHQLYDYRNDNHGRALIISFEGELPNISDKIRSFIKDNNLIVDWTAFDSEVHKLQDRCRELRVIGRMGLS